MRHQQGSITTKATLVATLIAVSLATLTACSNGGTNNSSDNNPPSDNINDSGNNNVAATVLNSDDIAFNQVGYLPIGEKVLVLPTTNVSSFQILANDSNEVVLEGQLSEELVWSATGDNRYKQVDFSALTTSGDYTLKVDGAEDISFSISQTANEQVHDAALKYYYFSRSSTELTATHAGQWARASGHLDDSVTVHASAASANRPAGSKIYSSKGWYDAGDYGKYVVNSGVSTYTLMAAFEHYPDFYATREINIPESGDATPDILDEIRWNLDWLATMQDSDGGVYHKLTTLGWPGKEMPNQDTRERFVIGKTTAASLNYAATLAVASRIYGSFSPEYSEQSAQWLAAAQNAWNWATANPNVVYQQPSDVSSGEYGDSEFSDEFSWAAAELYLATNEQQYLDAFNQYHSGIYSPGWQNVSALPLISLLRVGEQQISEPLYSQLKNQLTQFADTIVANYQSSAFAVAMQASDFVWGSNSVVLNHAIMLLQAYELTGDDVYRQVASGNLSYILGRNPTGYSFVTGFGHKSPLEPHHRTTVSDGVEAPIPGMIVGGPQPGQQDDCSYPSNNAAMSYIDDWCSYSTNEVAINWNAPLVYVLAALLSQ